MLVRGQPVQTLWETPAADGLVVIDQRLLPHQFETLTLRTEQETAAAIRDMVVRGAPLIGAVAGYGIHLALNRSTNTDLDRVAAEAGELLTAARPTAVNLRWAVDRCVRRIHSVPATEKRAAALGAAREIVAGELERSRRLGEHGAEVIRAIARRKSGLVQVLTHCNAGWLATIDYGTATAPIYIAHDAGVSVHVWVDETRPRNQGAALTAFELGEHGIPHTVIADNAGGHLMQHGKVDLVIVGADRVAANGDTANKIGTYLKALAAKDCNVPFYVALPSSTFDWSLTDGAGIPIEDRSADEVRYIDGFGPNGPTRVRLVPETSPAANPAFDVTPARLVTAFITEDGVVPPEELSRYRATCS